MDLIFYDSTLKIFISRRPAQGTYFESVKQLELKLAAVSPVHSTADTVMTQSHFTYLILIRMSHVFKDSVSMDSVN